MKKMLFAVFAICCLVTCPVAMVPAFPPPPPGQLLKAVEADLNGDGKPDTVTLETVPGTSKFNLSVNQLKVRGFLGRSEADPAFEPNGFYIVDIDSADRFKEIAVHSSGPSDDDEYLLYSFDGQSLKKMARLSRWPVFSGNGIVLVDEWMGFWAKKKKYVLNRSTRTLQFVPQEFYHVGVQATVEQSFPLFRQRRDTSVVAHLKPKSKIDILLCDCANDQDEMQHWYLIKSATGMVGWARLGSFQEKVRDVPWAD